ncbi:hypothetical protein DTL42_13075 [Bremerella cremea]|uniref:Uncharacterized protein n=1 Tax=Bremerella cremea TaxID=1031537 RepID=A0A368KTK6_9BACT|nr:hypothetical protein [Bremerella cremea]RCS49452.1 hypothetical protein DTL42_13075 [Bremerella cremea]
MKESVSGVKSVFFAKTWYLYVGAILFSMLALFFVVSGPLFLLRIVGQGDARKATEAGVALLVMSVPMCLVALLSWFNVYARRRPLLRICKEGLEVNVIGASSLGGGHLVPVWVRVAWLVLTRQGFKRRVGLIPWHMLRHVGVSGLPMMKKLEIEGTIIFPAGYGDNTKDQVLESIAFDEADFRDSLVLIASAIHVFQDDPEARDGLLSLHG